MKKSILAALCALSVSAPAMAAQSTGLVDVVSTQGEGDQTVYVLTKVNGAYAYYVGTNGGVAAVLSDAMNNNKTASIFGGSNAWEFKAVTVYK
jgi:hypothetical protein